MKWLLSILRPDGAKAVDISFDGNEPASVIVYGNHGKPVFTLLPDMPRLSRWGPAIYGDIAECEGRREGVRADIDFDGQFDMMGRWDCNTPGGIAEPWIYDGRRWLEAHRQTQNSAIVQEGNKAVLYRFVESRGWVKDEVANKVSAIPVSRDSNEVGFDRNWNAQVITRFDDVEVAKCEIASMHWEGLLIGRQGRPLVMLTKPLWKSNSKASLVIEVAVGNMAGFVNGEVTESGIESLRVFTRDRKGGLFLQWSAQKKAWQSCTYLRVGQTGSVEGDLYSDLNVDGQFDMLTEKDPAGKDKDYAWIAGGWRPIIGKGSDDKGVLLRRNGKVVRFLFDGDLGWKEVRVDK